VGRLETASKFGHLIESFNINTNGWAASYVYKRLKFMNNRIISQVDTLLQPEDPKICSESSGIFLLERDTKS
jgi:hypothetical protein